MTGELNRINLSRTRKLTGSKFKICRQRIISKNLMFSRLVWLKSRKKQKLEMVELLLNRNLLGNLKTCLVKVICLQPIPDPLIVEILTIILLVINTQSEKPNQTSPLWSTAQSNLKNKDRFQEMIINSFLHLLWMRIRPWAQWMTPLWMKLSQLRSQKIKIKSNHRRKWCQWRENNILTHRSCSMKVKLIRV